MTLTMQELRGLATRIIDVCALLGWTAVVGGGAPRDALFGVAVKDIDVFVTPKWADEFVKFDGLAAAVDRVFGRFGVSHEQSNQPDYESFGLATVSRGLGEIPVQLISVCRDPLDDVHHYDFGLSQIIVTASGTLFTDAHNQDAEHGHCTYMGSHKTPASARLRSAARLLRLRQKYPHFQFLNTEPLENL